VRQYREVTLEPAAPEDRFVPEGRGREGLVTVFTVSVVVGAAVPVAVYRWGLCPLCSGVGRCLSGVY